MTFSRQFLLSSLPLFAALPLFACSAPAEPESDERGGSATADNVGEVRSKLDVLSTICQIADSIPEIDTGNFHLDEPNCDLMESDALHYLGSGPSNYAANQYNSTYCTAAVPGGGDNDAKATFNTIVGQFGAVSALRTSGRDNLARHVDLEHFGKVVVFGVEIPMQYSVTEWDFPREHQWSRNLPARQVSAPLNGLSGWASVTKRVPDTNGFYVNWHNQGISEWSIGGNGVIMITPAIPLHLEVSLKSHNETGNSTNGRFDDESRTTPSAFSALVDQLHCEQGCGSNNPICVTGCGRRTTWQVKCTNGCNEGFWHNLSDGILPYSGNRGGSSGNLLYGDPTDNYWHQGYPAGRSPNRGEPSYSALGSSPKLSTEFMFHTYVPYAFGLNHLEFGQTLRFDTRVGAALRTRLLNEADGNSYGDTMRITDAETAVNLNAYLDVTFDFGFWLPSLSFHFDYDLIDRTRNGHKIAQANSAPGYAWNDYRDGDSDAGTDSCLYDAPPETTVPQPPSSAWTGIRGAAAASVKQFHPCNVQVCSPSAPNSSRGTLTYYDLQPDYSLRARPTSETCDVCTGTHIDMCNADNRVIQPYASGSQGGNCGGTGPACGTNSACDDNDDCTGSNEACDGHCCFSLE